MYRRFCPTASVRFMNEDEYNTWKESFGLNDVNSFNWQDYFKYFIEPKLPYPYDFSEQSAIDMFSFESTGKPKLNLTDRNSEGKFNGYLVGKHWMDATIAMWSEDIKRDLFRFELVEDFPEWFLQKIAI